MEAFSRNGFKWHLAWMLALILVSNMGFVSALSFYDSDKSDALYWTHRIPIIFEESEGVGRVKEPVTLNMSTIFKDMNLSVIDKSSIRIVDPDRKRIDQLNGHTRLFQLDDDGDGVLSKDDELSFLADVDAYSEKTYYVYYSLSGSGIAYEVLTTDVKSDYDGAKTMVFENDRLSIGGFITGYLAIYRMEAKYGDINLPYNPLGLDHGYSIESSKSNETFIRYEKNWVCNQTASGPIRVKFTCESSSTNFEVEKKFTFYSRNSFYDTENIIRKKSPLISNVKWVIYDIVNPLFSNETGKYNLLIEGVGENKVSHLKALDSASGFYFQLLAKGDADLYFEDREIEYDLFGETIHLASNTEKSVLIRHVLVEAGSSDEFRQNAMFKSPLSVKVASMEENMLKVIEPNPESIFDVAFENQSVIPIKASILHDSGVSKIQCNITNSFGKIVYDNILLYNDGTHGDEANGDDVWTSLDGVRLYYYDPTGIWNISCVENGSQTVSTQADSSFYIVKDRGYRRIEFFNIYCKSGERFKHNPARVRPGGIAELHICLMNTGTQDEENIQISMPDIPLGWHLKDVFVEKLVIGDEVPLVMLLQIPDSQKPTSEKLNILITANGTVTGSDQLMVDVVSPKIDATVQLKDQTLLVKALDEGSPVPDAQVRLSYSSGKIQSSKTDVGGLAIIPAIDTGDILITVSKRGYNSTNIRLAVSETPENSYWFILPIGVLILILAHLAYTQDIGFHGLLGKK